MKYIVFCLSLIGTILLAGCNDLMEAVSGINSKANEAAQAISEDVHTLRSIEVELQESSTTINDLVKKVIRDVQWKYEKLDYDILHVKGTWKDGLFAEYSFSEDEQKILRESGKISVTLFFAQHELAIDKTEIQLVNNGNLIVSLTGEGAFNSLIEAYLTK